MGMKRAGGAADVTEVFAVCGAAPMAWSWLVGGEVTWILTVPVEVDGGGLPTTGPGVLEEELPEGGGRSVGLRDAGAVLEVVVVEEEIGALVVVGK